MKSHNVLLISDSCFAGTLFDVSVNLPNIQRDNRRYRWAITSGNNKITAETASNESNSENQSIIQRGLAKNNGIFAYSLIKALLDKPENKEYSFTPMEIFTQIEKYILDKKGQTPQHKVIAGDSGGKHGCRTYCLYMAAEKLSLNLR